MKVALVHDYLDIYGGGERVFEAIASLYPDADIFTLLADKKITDEHFKGHKITESQLKNLPFFIRKSKSANHKYLLPFIPRAVDNLDLSDYDLVISSSGAWTKGVITSSTAKHVCYCHTPARFLWDYTNEFQKEARLKGLKKFIINRILTRIRIWDYASSQRVDQYIANSTTVQKRIKKYYGRDSIVIHPNVDTHKYRPQESHDNYALIISRLEKYKNTHLAVETFKDLPNKKLIIAGKGSELENLKKQAQGHDNIQILGFVDDEKAINLIQNCQYFIFPAEDDFGIAPVEAMAAGKPTVALGRGGALDTVIPGKTGILFPNPTVTDLKKAISALDNLKFNTQEIATHANKFSTANFKNNFIP